MDRFVSLSIWIANSDPASVCQIALVTFENGAIVDEWSTYVNPEMDFIPLAVKVHGITPEKVFNAPAFPSVYPDLARRINNSTLVTYNQYDIDRLEKATARYRLTPLAYVYLDTSKLIRSSFSRRASADTEKDEILQFMHIPLQYPDALDISRTVGRVVLDICRISGLTVGGWVREVDHFFHLTVPNNPSRWHDRTGNPNGSLYGHTVVFVGVFAIPRHILAILASDRGCHVSSHINKNTTVLAMGRLDPAAPFYMDDEMKLNKIKKWIENGVPIQLLTEQEFFNLLEPS